MVEEFASTPEQEYMVDICFFTGWIKLTAVRVETLLEVKHDLVFKLRYLLAELMAHDLVL